MSNDTGVIPRDAKETVELWDKGEAIAAFEVESEGATQLEIYSAAMEMIRNGRVVAGTPEGLQRVRGDLRTRLTKRELDVAHSIAHVALLKGWAAMVAQHLAGGKIRAITITKPGLTMPVEEPRTGELP
jgi:hypothetical protein